MTRIGPCLLLLIKHAGMTPSLVTLLTPDEVIHSQCGQIYTCYYTMKLVPSLATLPAARAGPFLPFFLFLCQRQPGVRSSRQKLLILGPGSGRSSLAHVRMGRKKEGKGRRRGEHKRRQNPFELGKRSMKSGREGS